MFKKIILFIGLLLGSWQVFAQDFPPKSNTIVTDYTNTLTSDQKQQLERKLVAFNDTSSTQIAVVILKSIGDYDVNEYAAALGRKWGVGQKGKNNGIMVLVAKDDHKLSIQTGYGVEGALPDIITQQIRVNDMNPRFKAGDFYGGLDAGTDDIIKYTKGEYKAENRPQRKQKDDGGGSPIGFIIIIVIVILVAVFRNRGGGGGHVIGSRGGASPFWWFLAGSMLGGSGNRGGSDWGGFSGGGGGDSGGGGFGGFGGGDFGGGGSGGSW